MAFSSTLFEFIYTLLLCQNIFDINTHYEKSTKWLRLFIQGNFLLYVWLSLSLFSFDFVQFQHLNHPSVWIATCYQHLSDWLVSVRGTSRVCENVISFASLSSQKCPLMTILADQFSPNKPVWSQLSQVTQKKMEGLWAHLKVSGHVACNFVMYSWRRQVDHLSSWYPLESQRHVPASNSRGNSSRGLFDTAQHDLKLTV